MRRARLAPVLVVVLAVLAGCVAPKEQSTPAEGGAGPASPSGEVPSDLEGLYEQEVAWSSCDDLECAVVRAPLDWDDPAAGTIELALSRLPASGDADARIGSLLVNPGGPGASGVDYLGFVGQIFGDALLESFDVVGFDPRGVGASSAVSCGPDEVVDAFLTTDLPVEDAADLEEARAQTRAFGEACVEATGELIEHVDTVSAARDMDLLRAVLGDEQLHYLGFSYGTFLGATYAELFPDRAGRLVLDGALDPSLSIDEVSAGQAVGFAKALRAYVADCQSGADCPLRGDVDDGLEQIDRMLEQAERQGFPAGGEERVNGTLASYGITAALYEDAAWPALTMALDEVLVDGSASILLQLANLYLDRTPDGRYESNTMLAFNAINCLDYPSEELSFEELSALADEVAQEAPLFGRDFMLSAGCEAWPVESTGERRELHAAGAAPILVIGTTGDPATPYEWSVNLAEQLESGVLLTFEGEGHTAYGRGNACVAEAVEGFLVEGTVPADGTTC